MNIIWLRYLNFENKVLYLVHSPSNVLLDMVLSNTALYKIYYEIYLYSYKKFHSSWLWNNVASMIGFGLYYKLMAIRHSVHDCLTDFREAFSKVSHNK